MSFVLATTAALFGSDGFDCDAKLLQILLGWQGKGDWKVHVWFYSCTHRIPQDITELSLVWLSIAGSIFMLIVVVVGMQV